jgi:hypothetical protein
MPMVLLAKQLFMEWLLLVVALLVEVLQLLPLLLELLVVVVVVAVLTGQVKGVLLLEE